MDSFLLLYIIHLCLFIPQMQNRSSYLSFFLPIMLTICLLASGRQAISQQLSDFPPEVEQFYMEEKYPEACANSLKYLLSIQSIPDSLKSSLFIRLAFFYSWTISFINADTFADVWKKNIGIGIEFDQLPANELADYYSMKAVIASYDNRKDDAIDTLKIAIRLRLPKTPLDWAIQADGYQFRGNLEKEMLDYSEAILSFREAENINDRLGRKGANCGIWLEKAQASLEVDPDNPQILQDINEALEYYQGISSYEKIAHAYNELGFYWRVQGNLEKSINNFLYALRIKKMNHITGNIHIAYNNLSATYNSMSKLDSVMYYMRKAIDSTKANNYKQKALYYSNLGAIYGHLNKPDSALHYFNGALEILYPKESLENLSYNPDPSVFDPILPVIIGNKGSALFELAKNQNDDNYLTLAIEALKISVKQFNDQRFMLSFETKTLNVKNSRAYYFLALEASAESYRQNNTAENLSTLINFAQQSKAAVFNEYQRVLKARDSLDIDPRIIFLDDSLKSKRSALSQAFYTEERLKQSDPNRLSLLTTEIIQTNGHIQKISKEIENQYPTYSKYIHIPDDVSAEEIRSSLKPDEVLIDYTLSAKSLIILAISTDQVRVKTMQVPNYFHNQIKQYLSHMHMNSRVGFSEYIHLAFGFWELLLEPIEDMIIGKQLIIIPDGGIGYLPFDTFVTDSIIPQRKHYNELPLLIKSYSISYLNSIEQFIATRQSANSKPVGIQAFAPFSTKPYIGVDKELSALSGSKEEVVKISKYALTRKHLGRKATKKAFKKEMTKPDVMHLATHGILSSGNPMNNRILFHQTKDETELFLFEVINMTINSKLVVLSACETGSGEVQEGEGIMSLTRGFHYAGAPRIVMSLWPAFDTPSVQIMEEFYKELANNTRLADALRKSKLKYLNMAMSSESHPGLWANYQLSGVNDYLPLKSRTNRLIWIGLISIIIIMIITYFFLSNKKLRIKQ